MKSARWLDIAIKITLVLVVAAGGYLGYSVWSHNKRVEASSPAGRALGNLASYVSKNPKDIEARVTLAQTLIAVGRESEAVEQYRAILRIDKKHIGALTGIGMVSMRMKEHKTAEGYWRRAIEVLQGGQYASKDARLEQCYFYLGQTLISDKRYTDAVGYLREALRIRPDASDTHYSLSVAYKELGTKRKQREELETALAFEPAMAEANYDLGLVLLAEGDEAGAAERFRISADKAPKGIRQPAEELAKLGKSDDRERRARELAEKDVKAALVQGRVALALDPADTELARFVAGLYEKLGKKEQAKGLYEKILDRVPEDAAAKKAIARLTSGK